MSRSKCKDRYGKQGQLRAPSARVAIACVEAMLKAPSASEAFTSASSSRRAAHALCACAAMPTYVLPAGRRAAGRNDRKKLCICCFARMLLAQTRRDICKHATRHLQTSASLEGMTDARN